MAKNTTDTIAGILDDAGIEDANAVAQQLVASFRDNVANFPSREDCADWATELVGDVFPWDDDDDDGSDALLGTTIEDCEKALLG